MAENAIQISTKRPSGEIYLVGGLDFNEFRKNLGDLYGGSDEHANAILKDMQDAFFPSTEAGMQAAANVVQGNFPQAAPAPSAPAPYGAPAPQAQQAQRAAAGPPPGQAVPVCDHGVARVWKTGRSARGPWQAWMCYLRKDEGGCEPLWA